jgi:hypothetical protein
MLPGTVGHTDKAGAYADFEECVAANQQLDPVEFEFEGGLLGVWLLDSRYEDNVGGPDGRAPSWQLTRLDSCTD